MVQIELDPIPAQTFQTLLDSQACTITLYQRSDHLYLDLYLGDSAVALGCPCLERCSLIPYQATAFLGSLYFFDTKGNTDPQWDGLEDRYVFLYFTDDEEIPDALTADYIEDNEDE